MSKDHLQDIGELFQSVNTPVEKEELIQIEQYFQQNEDNETERAAVQWLCEQAEVTEEDFYFLPNHGITPFCYYKDGIFLGFNVLSIQYFEWTNMGEGLDLKIQMTKEAVKKGKFSKLLDLTETIAQPLVFEYYFHQLPDDKKYELFIDMYILQEYGFTYYQPEIVKEAIEKLPAEYRERAMEELLKEDSVGEDGTITIYRGMGEASTPIEQAMSWTLSPKIAYFFANRFGRGGYIVKAQTQVNDVIDFINRRNEKEIVVLPEHVTILENEKAIDTAEEMELLEDKGLVQEYQMNVKGYLREEHFKNPTGIHGSRHMKRVLLHCLSLSNAIGLPENERGILVLTALYHDIGRTHDYGCTEHGKWSVEKKKELDLPSEYVTVNEWGDPGMVYPTEEEEEVMEFLMTYHCRNDKEAESAWNRMEDGETKEMIKRLFPVFKDADALDRVRIGDLDPTYLRTPEAKKRLQFAEDVYKMLE